LGDTIVVKSENRLMRYEEAKNIAPKEFKRLSGVDQETFSLNLKFLIYQVKKN
jgi:hypothetical protein